jgi:uncharacterized protein YdaU (DUF1376 family)
MNYFELYPGDYLRDTTRLTLVEHGAYLRLLMTYYSEEEPLPADENELFIIVSAISDADKAAVRKVAARFFPVREDGTRRNDRVDAEIVKARRRIESARSNGGKGGRPTKNPNETYEKPTGFQSGSENDGFSKPKHNPAETHSGEALHTPHAIHQEQKQRGGKPPALTLPDWLPQSTWSDWHNYRNSRKGWTQKARELSLRTLSTLYEQGHDPRTVIEQSIEKGWTGLFPVRTEKIIALPQDRKTESKTLQALRELEAAKHEHELDQPGDQHRPAVSRDAEP